MLQPVLYSDWRNPDKVFTPPKRFAQQYAIKEGFLKKWAVPVVDPVISYLNEILFLRITALWRFPLSYMALIKWRSGRGLLRHSRRVINAYHHSYCPIYLVPGFMF